MPRSLKGPLFPAIVRRDLRRAAPEPDRLAGLFMDTFFHHPDELQTEIADLVAAATK